MFKRGRLPCRVPVYFTQAERISLANWEVSVQGVLSFPTVAKQKSRSFEFCGGLGGLDVSAAADVDAPSDDEDPPYDAWVASRKDGKEGGGPMKKPGSRSQPADGRR